MRWDVSIEVDRLEEIEQSLLVKDRDAGFLRDEPSPAAAGRYLVIFRVVLWMI